MSFNGQQLEDIELIDFRRQQLINSEVEYRNYWSKVLRDGWLTMASLSILVVLLIASKGEDWGEGMRFILTFTIVLKLSLLIPVEIIYLWLINFKWIRPSNIQLIKLFSVVPWTSWYIYAWIKFFHSSNAWKQQSVPLYRKTNNEF